MERIIIAITGASGAPYARALIRELAVREDVQLCVMSSKAGEFVYEYEIGIRLEEDLPKKVKLYKEDDFASPFASGSVAFKAMVIIPCTMATLGAIAWGNGRNIIHRASDVCLKEGRKLILVPRETPLHKGHLENMLRCAELGAVILPAMPGFYHRPSSVEDIVNFVVARILDHLGLKHNLLKPWQGL